MVGINENIRSDNSQEALQSDHDQGSINVAISHKINDGESSSVTLNLSTIIHDKVPKNLDVATQEARLVSFVIVYEKGNVIILGRYSENSINTIGQKFSATSLDQVCLRILKQIIVMKQKSLAVVLENLLLLLPALWHIRLKN